MGVHDKVRAYGASNNLIRIIHTGTVLLFCILILLATSEVLLADPIYYKGQWAVLRSNDTITVGSYEITLTNFVTNPVLATFSVKKNGTSTPWQTCNQYKLCFSEAGPNGIDKGLLIVVVNFRDYTQYRAIEMFAGVAVSSSIIRLEPETTFTQPEQATPFTITVDEYLQTPTTVLPNSDGGGDIVATWTRREQRDTNRTVVTLTPPSGSEGSYDFWFGVNWQSSSGDPAYAANAKLTVTTGPQVFTLSVLRTGTGGGTVTSYPAGIDCGSSCSTSYLQGTSVTLTATADANSTFAGWNGCDSISGNQCTVIMNTSKSVTATFNAVTPQIFTLTVTKAGTGNGTVTSSPSGIDCGSTCSASFSSGTVVTLTATASSGSGFAGWSGDSDCTDGSVTMNAGKSCTATFNTSPTGFTLTVTKVGNGSGTVISSPAGINCGSTCSASFTQNASVTLTANPDVNSSFSSWSGCDSVSGNQCTVTMSSNRSVTATFSLVSQPASNLTVSVAGFGEGLVTSNPPGISCTAALGTALGACSANFPKDSLVTLSATAYSGSSFDGWTGAGCSGTADCSVTMDANKSVMASFSVIQSPDLSLESLGLPRDPSLLANIINVDHSGVIGETIEITLNIKNEGGAIPSCTSGGTQLNIDAFVYLIDYRVGSNEFAWNSFDTAGAMFLGTRELDPGESGIQNKYTVIISCLEIERLNNDMVVKKPIRYTIPYRISLVFRDTSPLFTDAIRVDIDPPTNLDRYEANNESIARFYVAINGFDTPARFTANVAYILLNAYIKGYGCLGRLVALNIDVLKVALEQVHYLSQSSPDFVGAGISVGKWFVELGVLALPECSQAAISFFFAIVSSYEPSQDLALMLTYDIAMYKTIYDKYYGDPTRELAKAFTMTLMTFAINHGIISITDAIVYKIVTCSQILKLAAEGKLFDAFVSSIFCVFSPAELLIQDSQGRRLGFINGVSIVEIPGGEALLIDHDTYIRLPQVVTDYTVVLVGTGSGDVTIGASEVAHGGIQYALYENISVLLGSILKIASLDTNPQRFLEIDRDGDGDFEESILPSESSFLAGGDITQDGKINVIDARICLQKALGLILGVSPDPCDVDGDNSVTQADAEKIAQFSIGLIDSLATAGALAGLTLMLGLPLWLWRGRRALWILAAMLLSTGFPLTSCAPLIPLGTSGLVASMSGDDAIIVHVQDMSGGGLAAFEAKAGGFLFNPKVLEVTEILPESGWTLLASQIDNSAGEVRFAVVNPTAGILSGKVLTLRISMTGVPGGVNIHWDKTKLTLGDANNQEIPASQYETAP